MSSKVGNFVKRIVMHFPVRFDSEAREAEWLGSIIEAVGFYEAEVLERAAQRIIDTRTDRRFPLPAEIRKACAEVVSDERSGRLVPSEPKDEKANPWSEERVALANDLVKGELGRRAARENWLLMLHDFTRKNARLPTSPHEIAEIKRKAAEFIELYEQCVRGGWDTAKAMQGYGDGMLKRQEILIAMVLGEGR